MIPDIFVFRVEIKKGSEYTCVPGWDLKKMCAWTFCFPYLWSEKSTNEEKESIHSKKEKEFVLGKKGNLILSTSEQIFDFFCLIYISFDQQNRSYCRAF